MNEDGPGPVEPAPVGYGVGYELRAIVEPEVDRRTANTRDLVQASDHPVGIDGSLGDDSRTLSGELVDDIQELQGLGIGCLVELEVEGPEHVGPDRGHCPD